VEFACIQDHVDRLTDILPDPDSLDDEALGWEQLVYALRCAFKLLLTGDFKYIGQCLSSAYGSVSRQVIQNLMLEGMCVFDESDADSAEAASSECQDQIAFQLAQISSAIASLDP
jgi:hypothetical protein